MNKMIGDLQVLEELPASLVCQDASGAKVQLRRLQVAPEKKAMDRGLRRASWLQHSGWCSLREFVLAGEAVYLRGPLPCDTLPASYIQQSAPPLDRLVGWLMQLVEMLMEVHNQRMPLYLGCLTNADLRVTPKGLIQLVGLDLNEEFKLQFRSAGDRPAPDAVIDARSDIWSLGKIFQEWVDGSSDQVRQEYDSNRALRELVASMTSAHPERRPSNVNILKSRLEQQKYKAPQENRGLLGKLPAAWELAREEYQKLLIGALATFVTGIVVTGWLFPA